MSRFWPSIAALALLSPGWLRAAGEKEQPVGLVFAAAGGKVLRAGSELPLAAKPGDILFPGDSLRSLAEPLQFLYCPEKSLASLAPKGEVTLTAGQLKTKTGQLAGKTPVASCLLPQTVRVAVASQQHYGVTMTRALRPAQQPAGTLASRVQALPADQRDALLRELQPMDAALAANVADPVARLSRATVLEKFKLTTDAVEEYRKAADEWKEAVWIRGKIFELEESLALSEAKAAAAAEPGAGKTFALLVGVSEYQRLPQTNWLQFAHADAAALERHLKSPRGGALPDENVALLTNQKATTAAIRNAFETFLKGRAGKQDTVLLFLAAHGTVETAGSRGAYILTFDSDPQDLASTALPMADVQELIRDKLSSVGRVLVFVDVCRAGNIGAIRSTMVNSVVERLGEAEGEIFGLMASRPKELSFEGPEFGGGHGAFSYFLLKALSGAADKNQDKIVDANEIIAYVRDKVAEATRDRQHPRDFGSLANDVGLADVSKPGIEVARGPAPADHHIYLAMAGEPPGLPAALQAAQRSAGSLAAVGRFRDAIAARRLLPDSPGSAFSMLGDLKRALTAEQYLLEENQLRIALENEGQQILLRYLTGDQTPQTRADFASGAAHFDAARKLTQESLLLEARYNFCQGRTLLFDKQHRAAADLLEQAARTDPGGAYSYNALGIAYLEQADYASAILSFRDALRRAPYWAYPLHNLALTHTEMGDYRSAVRYYQQAMRLAPQYSYLPYNLGLVYQRLNQRKDAEAAYRRAIALSPESPEPYNALGSLQASMGRHAEAERLFRAALEKKQDFLAARHNLALLLAPKPDRAREAIQLWETNLSTEPGYLPSRLSLAGTLAQQGQGPEAVKHYLAVVNAKPDYLAARLALADLLLKTRQLDEALGQLQQVLQRQPGNAEAHERLGDVENARGRPQQALAAYQAALQHAEPAARKQIRTKIKQVR